MQRSRLRRTRMIFPEEKLQGWRSVGINRLSIGVQSFFDEDLEWMNSAAQCISGVAQH